MWQQYRRRLAVRERLCETAEAAFRAAYPDRQPFMVGVFHQDDLVAIVQICYGDTRPPQRSWWRVALEGTACRELSHEETQRIKPIPVWR